MEDVRTILAGSAHVHAMYKAIVEMVSQPAIAPVDFAMRLEGEGIPHQVVLNYLRAMKLVVRAKTSALNGTVQMVRM